MIICYIGRLFLGVQKHNYGKLRPMCVCFCFFKFFLLIYLFIYGCVGSSFLCEGFLQLWRAGATLHRGVRASRYRGLSCCGAQAPDAQAQQLWLTGLVASRRVGSSQTRARTCVPCIGRQILNHCATREAPNVCFMISFLFCSTNSRYKQIKSKMHLEINLTYIGNFHWCSSLYLQKILPKGV